MKKTIDAVQMVRKIRDDNYKEKRGMLDKDIIKYYQRGAALTRKKFKKIHQLSH